MGNESSQPVEANVAKLPPLHLAAYRGDIEQMKKLLKSKKTVVSMADSENNTAIYYAVASSKATEESVKMLLEAGADITLRQKDGATLLMKAVLDQKVKIVDLLLNYGARLNEIDHDLRTALHFAAFCGDAVVGTILLDRGALANMKDNEGRAPLHWAAFQGHAEFARMILKRGAAKVDAEDSGQRTPLIYAAHNGHVECVQVLLDAGAKVGLKDAEDKTALDHATHNAHAEIIRIITKEIAMETVNRARQAAGSAQKPAELGGTRTGRGDAGVFAGGSSAGTGGVLDSSIISSGPSEPRRPTPASLAGDDHGDGVTNVSAQSKADDDDKPKRGLGWGGPRSKPISAFGDADATPARQPAPQGKNHHSDRIGVMSGDSGYSSKPPSALVDKRVLPGNGNTTKRPEMEPEVIDLEDEIIETPAPQSTPLSQSYNNKSLGQPTASSSNTLSTSGYLASSGNRFSGPSYSNSGGGGIIVQSGSANTQPSPSSDMFGSRSAFDSTPGYSDPNNSGNNVKRTSLSGTYTAVDTSTVPDSGNSAMLKRELEVSKAALSDSRKSTERCKEQITQLTAEKKQLEADLEVTRANLDQSKQQLINLRRELQDTQQKLVTANEKIKGNMLNRTQEPADDVTMAVADEQIHELKRELSQAQYDLERESERAKTERTILQEKLNKAMREAHALRSELEASKADGANNTSEETVLLRSQVQDLEAKVAKIKAKALEYKKEAQQERKVAKTANIQSEAMIQAAQAAVTDIETSLRSSVAQAQEARDAAVAAAAARDQALGRIETLEVALAKKGISGGGGAGDDGALAVANKRIEELTAEVAELTKSKSALKRDRKAMKEQMSKEKMESELAQQNAQTENAEMRAAIETLQERLASAVDSGAMSDLQRRYNVTIQELAAAKGTLADMQTQVDQSRVEADHLRIQLDNVRGKLDLSTHAGSSAESELEVLRRQLEDERRTHKYRTDALQQQLERARTSTGNSNAHNTHGAPNSNPATPHDGVERSGLGSGGGGTGTYQARLGRSNSNNSLRSSVESQPGDLALLDVNTAGDDVARKPRTPPSRPRPVVKAQQSTRVDRQPTPPMAAGGTTPRKLSTSPQSQSTTTLYDAAPVSPPDSQRSKSASNLFAKSSSSSAVDDSVVVLGENTGGGNYLAVPAAAAHTRSKSNPSIKIAAPLHENASAVEIGNDDDVDMF